jgi:hypothetical protein
VPGTPDQPATCDVPRPPMVSRRRASAVRPRAWPGPTAAGPPAPAAAPTRASPVKPSTAVAYAARYAGWEPVFAPLPLRIDGELHARLIDLAGQGRATVFMAIHAGWTTGTGRELVRGEFGVGLSAVSVGQLLGKMGLSRQRSLWRAYQQDPKRWRGGVSRSARRSPLRAPPQGCWCHGAGWWLGSVMR